MASGEEGEEGEGGCCCCVLGRRGRRGRWRPCTLKKFKVKDFQEQGV